jgi:hypothetical protein
MPSKKTRKAILKDRAIKYSQAGWATLAIANELGCHPSTVRRWLSPLGMTKARGQRRLADYLPVVGLDEPVYENEDIPGTFDDTIKITKHDARLAEDNRITDTTDAHTDPKEAYKSFMVNMGMKKMRDGLMNMPPPRTIKEAEVLDQIIRRNADMDPKRGGGGGTIIDISILNDPHTAMTAGSVISVRKGRKDPPKVITALSSEVTDETEDPSAYLIEDLSGDYGSENEDEDSGEDEEYDRS